MVDLGDWNERLAPLFADERYLKIRKFLIEEYDNHVVYPDKHDLYNCFKYTQFANLRVVLLGQDPYHNVGQAHGLCFSVQKGVPNPPSLENIFKELQSDIGCEKPQNGTLTKWAKEGVLLLNTSLSVREHQANSHSKCGWAWFTDSVIKLISEQKKNVVFILWGGNARSKKALIDTTKHHIIESAHPSPLSAYAGFFGSKPFSRTNEYLTKYGLKPIDWDLTESKRSNSKQQSLPKPITHHNYEPQYYTSTIYVNGKKYTHKEQVYPVYSKNKNSPFPKKSNTNISTGENTKLPPRNPISKNYTSHALVPPNSATIINKDEHWPEYSEIHRGKKHE